MIKDSTVLAIIPARGGSKRIPNKNIKDMKGKPLIGYAIDSAKESRYIDRLIVSTDSEEIAEVSKLLGAEVPFLRPADLSGDNVQDFPVFLHTIKWLEKEEGFRPDLVVQLRPTSPLRNVDDIDRAIEILAQNKEADSVRTVTEPEQSPYKMYSITEDGYLNPLLKLSNGSVGINMPQQELPKAYKHVGYVDVMWTKTILEKGSMTGDKILPLVLEVAYSGINTKEDWDFYEYLMDKNGY